jgi:oligopeptide/dipeptide ABC transporter ATP-binding protein
MTEAAVQRAPAPVLLRVQDLTVRFGPVTAVDGVSIVLHKGEILGLVGESGSGKSTLGRAILQIARPSAGSVHFDGAELTTLPPAELRRHRRSIQMIFQDPRGSLDPRMRVADILAEPMLIHRSHHRDARRERVREVLDIVGMGEAVLDRFPHELSGGQAQRIAIARALVLDPLVLVADEPISSLDVSVQAQVINLLSDLRARLGLAILFIAHDLAVVRHIADRVAVMYLGRVVELADRDELYGNPLHPYTRSLLSAVPVPDPQRERTRTRIILKGEIPSPDAVPPGCGLSGRCPMRAKLGNPDRCTVEPPALRPVNAAHAVACHFADAPLPTAPAPSAN